MNTPIAYSLTFTKNPKTNNPRGKKGKVLKTELLKVYEILIKGYRSCV